MVTLHNNHLTGVQYRYYIMLIYYTATVVQVYIFVNNRYRRIFVLHKDTVLNFIIY